MFIGLIYQLNLELKLLMELQSLHILMIIVKVVREKIRAYRWARP